MNSFTDLLQYSRDTSTIGNEHPPLCSCFHQEVLVPVNGAVGLGGVEARQPS